MMPGILSLLANHEIISLFGVNVYRIQDRYGCISCMHISIKPVPRHPGESWHCLKIKNGIAKGLIISQWPFHARRCVRYSHDGRIKNIRKFRINCFPRLNVT